MNDEKIDAIKKICESLEERMNTFMLDILDQYDQDVAVNVLINLSTSLMAKALLMMKDEIRPHIQLIAYSTIDEKVKEGDAAIHSLVAIGKAMGSTCTPKIKR